MSQESYLALWRGNRYPANACIEADRLAVRLYTTEPTEGFDEAGTGRFLRVVPFGELESFGYQQEVCEWRGEPFRIVSRDEEGKLLLEYTGGQLPVAERLGLARVERGVHRVWVPASEVHNARLDEIRLST